jgi:hypothetical protein
MSNMEKTQIVKQGSSSLIAFIVAEIVAILGLWLGIWRLTNPHPRTDTWYLVVFFVLLLVFFISISLVIVRLIRTGGIGFALRDNVLQKVSIRGGTVFEQVNITAVVSIEAAKNISSAWSQRLILQDNTGQKIRLGLGPFNQVKRAQIAAWLVPLLSTPGITINGPVAETLAAWSGRSLQLPVYAAGVASEPRTVVPPKTHKRLILLAWLAVMTIIIVVTSVSLSNIGNRCADLAKNGIDTLARVTGVGLSYTKDQRRSTGYFETTDIAVATRVQATVTFTTQNGEQHTSTISVIARDQFHATLEEVYNQARTGRLSVRYLPNDPATVQATAEFNGTAVASCGQ